MPSILEMNIFGFISFIFKHGVKFGVRKVILSKRDWDVLLENKNNIQEGNT